MGHAMIRVVALPFQKAYPDELKISVARIQALIDTYRERERTGLIRLAHSPQQQVYLLFQRGQIINSYQAGDGPGEKLESWSEAVLNGGEASARLVQLSPLALQMCKLSIESGGDGSRTVGAVELRTLVSRDWNQSAGLRLVHLSWDTAEGTLLYEGANAGTHSIFFSAGRLEDEAGIASTFMLWSEAQCEVTTFTPDLQLTAWQEYYLRRIFAQVCDSLLPRYEEITGRAMVDSAIRSIALLTSRQKHKINLTTRQVVDQEVFPTPAEAADAYRPLLKTLIDQISSVIGQKLSVSIIQEILAGLSTDQRGLTEAFSLLHENSK